MKFPSFGLKRYLASVLTALAGILASDPSTAFLLPFVEYVAAALGITGVVHSGKAGTLGKNKILSLASLYPLLLVAIDSVPALQPYKHLIYTIGSLLGLSAVATTGVPKKNKK